ncbi:amidase [Thalassospira sp.]|uniref:amidase n=1 Tax=Thalassospira sp. TaxID=1912094 RepID=UPI0027338E43|nr:amidase family protein [Thalassospira sp.]MDP2697354.1 amidase family protein [Thalassospira sp.]
MGWIVDKARAAITRVDQLGERAQTLFTEFDPERILADAGRAEQRVATSDRPLPLAGMLVSVKDLYDEAGIVTTAGSRLLQDQPPASKDAPLITRIKEAGAVPFSRTNMSEFAYSGVGLNPHYGTPGNVFDETRISGGSTSGGALTVALGLADIALGTDTGGSVRIPSAINGLVGFKPSRQAVSGDGIHPLAPTFDTPGPLARDLATAIAAFDVMSGQKTPMITEFDTLPLTFAIPENAFVTDLDDTVQAAWDKFCKVLRKAGHSLVSLDFGFLQQAISVNKIIVSVEAHKIYGKDIKKLESCGDARVLNRIRFCETLSDGDIADAYGLRDQVIAQFNAQMSHADILLAPTLQMMAPTIADTEADFDRLNAAMLRNTSLLNLADACAISLPVGLSGGNPGAIMLAAPHGGDQTLLAAAQRIAGLL